MTQLYEVPKIDRTPLDQLLGQVYENFDYTILYKFELPVINALNIFKYLMSIKHIAGKMFPGYAGIGKEMEEQGLYYDVCNKIREAGIEIEESF